MPPYSRVTSARRWSHASASETSSTAAVPPISSATARAPTSVRSITTTCAPSDARCRALAAPIPDAAPVTSATFSWNSSAMRELLGVARVVEVERHDGGCVLLDRAEHELAEHRLRDHALGALGALELEPQREAAGALVPSGGGHVGAIGAEEDPHRVEAVVETGRCVHAQHTTRGSRAPP